MLSVITVLSTPNNTRFSVILILHAVSQLVLIRFSNIRQKRLVKQHCHKKCCLESFSSQNVHCSQFIIPIFFSTTFVAITRWTILICNHFNLMSSILCVFKKQDFQQTLQFYYFVYFAQQFGLQSLSFNMLQQTFVTFDMEYIVLKATVVFDALLSST